MVQLLKIKEQILTFISRHELYVIMAFRFAMALILFLMIGGTIGYMQQLQSFPVLLILAAACAFLPTGFTVFLAAALIILHFWSRSHILALMVLCLFGIMFFLYFRFTARKGYYTILTVILSRLGIPFVMPVAVGLIDEPQHVIAVMCGSVSCFLVSAVGRDAALFTQSTDQDPLALMGKIGNAFLSDSRILIYQVGFAAAVLAVYLLKKSELAHSREIALVTGIVLQVVIIGGGELFRGDYRAFLFVVLGCAVSAVISWVVSVFALSMDYSKMEQVQFEDDEYYYYVRAVPKTSVSVENKQIEKIVISDDSDFEMPEEETFAGSYLTRGKTEKEDPEDLGITTFRSISAEKGSADPESGGRETEHRRQETKIPEMNEIFPKADALEDEDFLPDEKPEKTITIIGQR